MGAEIPAQWVQQARVGGLGCESKLTGVQLQTGRQP